MQVGVDQGCCGVGCLSVVRIVPEPVEQLLGALGVRRLTSVDDLVQSCQGALVHADERDTVAPGPPPGRGGPVAQR